MRISIKSTALGLLAALSLAACSGRGSGELTYLAVKTDKGSHWGMLGPDGKILFDDEFENEPTAVVNGFFTVAEGKGLSVYKADKKPTLLGDLEGLMAAGMMSEGIIPVTRPGERISYYDGNGKLAFTLDPCKGKEIVYVCPMFCNGLATIMDEEFKQGAINPDGKVIVEPKYSSLSDFSEGCAVGALPLPDDAEGGESDELDDTPVDSDFEIIDTKGKVLAKITATGVFGPCRHGLFAGYKGERYGFWNKKGEFKKMPERVKSIGWFNSELFIFSGDDYKSGVMNMDGEILIRPKYEHIFPLSDTRFLCRSDNEKYYIVTDADEREVTIDDVKNMVALRYWVPEGMSTRFGILGANDHEYMLYGENGEPVDNNDYYEIGLNIPVSVGSDYFNAAGAAERLVSYLTDNGFEKAVIGEPIYKCVAGRPADYTRQDKYYFNNLPQGFRYTVSGYAYTDKYIAKSQPVYKTQTYWGYSYQSVDRYDYQWDTSAMIDRITVTLGISSEGQYENVKNAIVAAAKAKGFAVSVDKPAYAVLSKGNTRVFVNPTSSSSSSNVDLDIFGAVAWNSQSESRINGAVSRYDAIKSMQVPGGSPAVEVSPDVEVVEVADSIVADSIVK